MKIHTKEQILKIIEEYSTFSRLSGEHFGVEYVEDEYGIDEQQLKIWLSNPDYYQCPYCKQLESCPSVDDVQSVQNTLSVPDTPLMESFDISSDCVGNIQFDCTQEQQFTVCLSDTPIQRWSLSHLEEDTPQAIEARLIIGWSMYTIYMHYALGTRDQIPDPVKSIHYTANDFNWAKYWKWWSVQPPKS